MFNTEILFAFSTAVVFYILVPMLGAFFTRHKWRIFRRHVTEASISREVTYANPKRSQSGTAGRFCFAGGLQAIQENSSIWLNNGKISVKAEMKGLRVYLLPTSRSIENENRIEENTAILPKDMPKRLKWERVYSLAQGTGFVLAGEVFIENGTPVFRNNERNPLLVIIYDGKKESILRRSIWSGRQLNEYWNNLTPMSIIIGSFALVVLTFMSYRQGLNDTSAVLTVLSFIPIIPFFPPGLIFYFIFRRVWKAGRYLRGERDLLRLPLRHSDYVSCRTCREALERYPGVKLRSCGVIDTEQVMSMKCRVYSSALSGNRNLPDYFFEELVIPGDPDMLAQKCRSRARKMEILATASISFGFIINMIIIYLFVLRLF